MRIFSPPMKPLRFDGFADGPDRARLVWQIAPGYYLYRSRLSVATTSPAVQLGRLQLPAGSVKTDESSVGRRSTTTNSWASCRWRAPPTEQVTSHSRHLSGLRRGGPVLSADRRKRSTSICRAAAPRGGAFVSEQERLAILVRTGSPLLVLGTFFGLGLLLGFTPCVLPMVPILSGIIVGQGASITTRRAFTLSFTYVLGMALTYTAAGAAFAAFGGPASAGPISAAVGARPVRRGLHCACAVDARALYAADAGLRYRAGSRAQQPAVGGHLGGVAVMGALSALIVTTCVGPALVALLAVIAQTGAMARGAALLFALSLGMGTPLLIVVPRRASSCRRPAPGWSW